MTKHIVIRSASAGDDIYKIANLIYETDPYIYPDIALNKVQALQVICEMINRCIGVFRLDNLLVGYFDGELSGTLLVLNYAVEFNMNDIKMVYDELGIEFTIKQVYLWSQYFKKLVTTYQSQNGLYISNICVATEYRNKGVATGLINYLINQNKDKPLFLHVLKNNTNSIRLYEHLGFNIMDLVDGYSSEEGVTNLCYLMEWRALA